MWEGGGVRREILYPVTKRKPSVNEDVIKLQHCPSGR
jgi:hypothetical protein